jgi:ATP-dependent RNA helicase DeaD
MAETFADLGLSEPTLRAIQELGYEEPTPIQLKTIEPMMEGKDVIAQAQTGTGKTAAFALPIIEHLVQDGGKPQALVMTPTRELAVQVAEAVHAYGQYHRVKVLPVYGGQPIERQLGALKRGVQVVVGTPGRLLDHIKRRTLDLSEVRTVVLDEADEMLNMGFIEDIEMILQEIPTDHQTALFSATMPDPIVRLARKYLRDPQRIQTEAHQMSVPAIRQVYYEVGARDKTEVLVRMLDYEQPTSTLIFCRTKKEVDELAERLIARAFPAEAIHGDLNQSQRDRAMDRFRSGQAELLVATDVAARGLDVEHVSHVINYDIPLDPEVYVHRIGRTGRAGRSGTAITLVTPRERRLWSEIQRVTKTQVQRQQLPTVSDVISRRRENFKEALREAINGDDLAAYRLMAEEFGEEYSPTDVAAAAIKMLLGPQPDEAEDALARMEPGEVRRDDRERKPRREGRSFGPERGMTRLFIDIGRNDGVRPGDLVGAIANEADISGRSIGAIEIFDHFSFVEVPSQAADQVLKALRNTTIRNRKITANIAKPDERSGGSRSGGSRGGDRGNFPRKRSGDRGAR